MARKRGPMIGPGGSMPLGARYSRTAAGGWSAVLVREGVEVADLGQHTDSHDAFHAVLAELEARANRLDQVMWTIHGTDDGGPEEFALMAARGGWVECRDSVCTTPPVPTDDVDESQLLPMATFTAPISMAPPGYVPRG